MKKVAKKRNKKLQTNEQDEEKTRRIRYNRDTRSDITQNRNKERTNLHERSKYNGSILRLISLQLTHL